MVLYWIVAELGRAGTRRRSLECALGGGRLSTAMEAPLLQVVIWMQSGHAQEVAARWYVERRNPYLLNAT